LLKKSKKQMNKHAKTPSNSGGVFYKVL